MAKRISLKEPILSENDRLAVSIRNRFDAHGVVAINIMASPGAGKTTIIEQTVDHFKHEFPIHVIEGDVVDIDVTRIKNKGIDVTLANTGGACHLDAVMMQTALESIDLSDVNLLIVENVGNLICPANFTLGTHFNVVIASVPEGHDKPAKYPGMFHGADVILLNKYDYAELESFDLDTFTTFARHASSHAHVLPLSAKTGKGMEKWYTWLSDAMNKISK